MDSERPSQLSLEHLIGNEEVGSSILPGSTTANPDRMGLFCLSPATLPCEFRELVRQLVRKGRAVAACLYCSSEVKRAGTSGFLAPLARRARCRREVAVLCREP